MDAVCRRAASLVHMCRELEMLVHYVNKSLFALVLIHLTETVSFVSS